MTTMLDALRDEIRAKLEERASHEAVIDEQIAAAEARGATSLNEDESAKFTEARAAVKAIDEDDTDTGLTAMQTRLRDLEDREERKAIADAALGTLPAAGRTEGRTERQPNQPRVVVRSEPMTYDRGSRNSYIADLAHTAYPSVDGFDEARERMVRHGREVEVEARAGRFGEEFRANMSRTDGTGGEFVPPLWLMDQLIPLARAGRITADLCRGMALPAGTDSINLPRVATGTATAEQSDGGSVQKTDMTTNSVSAPVTTIAGQQVFAIQLLDQSPINVDEVVFGDLLADLATKVDTYVLTKSGRGILNVSGIVAVTYTDASPTVPELYPKGADTLQQIVTNRFLPPQAWVMHPRRWYWHLAALDSSNRPLVVPSDQGPTNAFAGLKDVRAEGAVGSLLGLPVYIDPNVPTNLGAGTNEDRIIGARFDDLYLWEGSLRTRALQETDADTLSVRLQVWEYLAFMGDRFPKSIGVISGTGLVTPTF